MAEDEDQEISAALAKLTEQDAAVAEDARAALEWIAGEPGRAFITQERIQDFCYSPDLARQSRSPAYGSSIFVSPCGSMCVERDPRSPDR
jgi:hypothetical protein